MRNTRERLQPSIFRLFLLLLHQRTDAISEKFQSGDGEEAIMSRKMAIKPDRLLGHLYYLQEKTRLLQQMQLTEQSKSSAKYASFLLVFFRNVDDSYLDLLPFTRIIVLPIEFYTFEEIILCKHLNQSYERGISPRSP